MGSYQPEARIKQARPLGRTREKEGRQQREQQREGGERAHKEAGNMSQQQEKQHAALAGNEAVKWGHAQARRTVAM